MTTAAPTRMRRFRSAMGKANAVDDRADRLAEVE